MRSQMITEILFGLEVLGESAKSIWKNIKTNEMAHEGSTATGFGLGTVLFQGTLPECEAWIRLTEEGYL